MCHCIGVFGDAASCPFFAAIKEHCVTEDGHPVAPESSALTDALANLFNSVTMFLTQPRREPQHQLDAFKLFQPFLNDSSLQARTWQNDSRRTGCSAQRCRRIAVLGECPISIPSARGTVFSHEQDRWNSTTTADRQFVGDIAVFISIEVSNL